MKCYYRVVTNNSWYEIEYRYKWWFLWFRYRPIEHYRHGYQPNQDEYRFLTLKHAVNKIEELREADASGVETWKPVITEPYTTDTGDIRSL